MTPEKIKEEVLKKIEEEYGIMTADSITAEAIDLALKKQAEAIFEEIYGWSCTAVPGADADDLDVWYLIKESVFNELKRKWCKK